MDLGPVLAVAAGFFDTCAVKANGELVCFGRNEHGQSDPPQHLKPVALGAGGAHTCAVNEQGELVCFGYNGYGQSSVPPDLGPLVAVAAGAFHTCAVKSTGELVCFGRNASGQCTAPIDLGPVVAVACGTFHTCAVKANGDLVCFGNNAKGACDVPEEFTGLSPTAANQPVLTEAVLQHVHHPGPAARIPAQEAAAIVAQQEASFIEHNLDSVGWDGPHPLAARPRVVLLHFSRSPTELKDVLRTCVGLGAVREELEQAGCNWILPSGAKILVAPRVYHLLLSHLNCNPALELQKCHVLVSEELESVVMSEVRSLRSRLRVCLADYEALSLDDATSATDPGWSLVAGSPPGLAGWTDDVDIVVRRSFLEFRPRAVRETPFTGIKPRARSWTW